MNRFLLLIISFLAFGCNGYQYVSAPNYVPLHTQKGEVKANVSFTYCQLGYSLTDHFSLFTSSYFRKRGTPTFFSKEGSGDTIKSDKTREFSIGALFYKKQHNLVYECAIGAGYGSINYNYSLMQGPPYYDFYMTANKINFYIQPEIGYKYDEDFEIAMFSKINLCRYINIDTSGTSGRKSFYRYHDYFIGASERDFLFLEPGFIIRTGFENLKGFFSTSYNINLYGNPIDYRQLNIYLGISLSFSIFEKKSD
jgi:hypothetical protein